ncbi:isoaspartyl peptidase/L-asparaginase family protein [Adhaeribacter aquaticus]|uniref:isoaspartyl peptidase/L-asparaginase family protein n=1 Tax=Adhaeribacter aquaticus TaxID=299567 RepID=UPI000415F2F6|nr:isoaspartyl peptidase/L-asparaginase [Adhaeribacter aquaticus]
MAQNFVLVIHGGAEDKTREDISPEKEAGYRKGLEEALDAGYQILKAGGSAIDAVEAAVISMENNPLFNAGKGGALTIKESHEFDAAIMDGKTLHAGGVAGVKSVKNPIKLARTIMEKSEHVLIGGDGATAFAKEHNLQIVPEAYFTTEEKLEDVKKQKQNQLKHTSKDTVGAVALDIHGNLAAATSTGGLTGQHEGRIGDSPIIGCGTYANNEVCAVSCTGDGESIIRGTVAHEVYALVKYKGLSITEAAAQAIRLYKDKIEKDRNLIALTPNGDIAMEFETELMFRGYRKGDEAPYIAIWED